MKFNYTDTTQGSMILANDHFATMPYDCSEITATDGVIPAGTIVPANDATAVGVLFNDVYTEENTNGTIVIHGFIDTAKLPVAPDDTAIAALSQITFIDTTATDETTEDTTEEETE